MSEILKLKFELLVIDTVEQSVIQSELNLLYSLLSIGSLWKTPRIDDQQNFKITDGEVILEAKRVTEDEASSTDINKAFLITALGSYEWLEPTRKVIVEFLKNQSFDYIYIRRSSIWRYCSKNLPTHLQSRESALLISVS